LGRETGAAPPPVLPAHGRRTESARGAAQHLGSLCRRDREGDGRHACVSGQPKSGRALCLCTCPPIRSPQSQRSWHKTPKIVTPPSLRKALRRKTPPRASSRTSTRPPLPSDCEH